MEGIVHLKALVIATLDLYTEAADDYKHKKISIWEGIKLVPNVFSLISAGKSVNEVLAEVIDGISDAERDDLENTIMTRFNVPNVKIKSFADHALLLVIQGAIVVNEYKHIHDPIVP
jgi:hypothetical protein